MKSWYCIHIKPTKENSVCHLLSDLPEVEIFNPKIQRCKHLRSKKYMAEESLFPGYMFVKIDAPRYARTIRYTRGVRRMVGDHSGHPWTVDDAIINFIKSRTEDDNLPMNIPCYNAGDAIRITAGPLTGLEGIFVNKMKANERVIVLLNTIENQIRLQIENSMIEKI